ncbi:hypothetical protein RJ640_017601 [Escallonia rubra]|uniref:Receptor-like serine/threonine-protein kinase n=1 Tax=Escallonia rubra TaxID=112253 RepID=A0AA88QVS1_9ASTE|nr:hypothetical protein RJ640_017601 [Escallonia rubra]
MFLSSRTWLLPTSLMLLYIFCVVDFSAGLDRISLGQSLNTSQTIISQGGKFELGFFTRNSVQFYMGIWYKNIPGQTITIVWVANRDMPISVGSYSLSQLVLSEDGNLTIFDGSKRPIWSTNSTFRFTNAREGAVVLLDTGNLVLSDEFNVVWQSFDYPTNTFLPGGKLGLDKTTNRSRVLTSWRSSDDPSSGTFSFGIDPSGSEEFFSWSGNRSERYWESGAWNGNTLTFSSVPEMSLNYIYNYSYVSNEKTNYFTYDLYNPSITSRFVLGTSGQVRLLMRLGSQQWNLLWAQPREISCSLDSCGANALCNESALPMCSCLPRFEPRLPREWESFNFSGGCSRRNSLQCDKDKEGFLKIRQVGLPPNPQSSAVGVAELCEHACIINCSCNAYAFVKNGDCTLWTGDLIGTNLLATSGQDFYLKLNAFELPGPNKGSNTLSLLFLVRMYDAQTSLTKTQFFPADSVNKRRLYIGLAVSISLLICGSLSCYLWKRKLNHKEAKETNQNLLLLNLDTSKVHTTSVGGNLLNGQSVAAKRLSKGSGQGLEELRNETILIAKLQHMNLVRLLGGCIDEDEKILIYEYMPNKSLDSFLFDSMKQKLLDWRTRVRIIEGISQGLLYLHQYSRLRIVHRDLKASNILLDAEMNPKISDFGLARIFGGNQLEANTNRIVGTYGYMSPEYAMEGLFSIKSDVFAFGVLLLEIVSGKKSTGFHDLDYQSLLGYAWELWVNDRVLELIDPTLDISSSSCTPLKYVAVGLLCVQEVPSDRPSMSEVVAMLSNEHTTLVSPKRPAFTAGRAPLLAASGREQAELCSVNRLTESVLVAR